ncbi:DNA alkylation repair protein [Nocardioides marmorisolisilvae]|uniref:DNA alkylation repair protein n=1 Tax=Nocardioides marmorisolisilvae TaxID=1542737 RepID=A0A3N0DSZ5_9ACTN|nr:DNA alkylation repair protein [Nocardioides marmorisolisilvae]RNL78586.1 DNA alkylation repair protein [Nocardioides marmorisolisilvae]
MPAAAIVGALRDLADPELAGPMAAYMKVAENGGLPFLGIRRPVVRRTTRGLARGSSPAELLDAVEALWDGADHREERYAAQDLLGLAWTRGRLDLLGLHEHHIVTGAWWDHVDETAHRISDLVTTHPAELAPVLVRWSTAEDRWLRRSAIISQLGRKDAIDLDLLATLIEPNLADREFFIRKAIGWALREVARWNPDWVLAYADGHDLSPLSRREALKHVL